MRYEWRIFFPKMKFDLWNKLIESDEKYKETINKLEEKPRTDYYFDINDPEAGLKERWVKKGDEYKPKIELKLLTSKDENLQVENWIKVISVKIQESLDPNKGLDQEKIKIYLEQEKNNVESKYNDKIENIINNIDSGNANRVQIDKKRKQIIVRLNEEQNDWTFYPLEDPDAPYIDKDSKSLMIEQTNIENIKLANKEIDTFMTICIEGTNKEIIEKFKTTFMKIDEGEIIGYPEFIMTLR